MDTKKNEIVTENTNEEKEQKATIRERVNNLEPADRKKLLRWFCFFAIVGLLYMAATNYRLYTDKTAEEDYWQQGLLDDSEAAEKARELGKDATEVTVGTYVENLKEINIKSNYFRVVFECWFRWEGDDELDMANNFRVYNGLMNKTELLEDYHKDGVNYQHLRVDATVQKNYWIVRFPLESYQLRLFLESDYPVDRVKIVPDTEHSTVNEHLNISGFKYMRSAVSTYTIEYASNLGNPESEVSIAQELCTSMEINRSGFGLYLKCFIALFGTITWVFITLFLCTYHRVDPLTMMPAALFGTVTNIMVGANLLPDALQVGLLEYVTIGGIMIIIACALSVININRIRNKNKNNEFAYIYGRTMFFLLLFMTLVGAVSYPLCSYIF